jgi:ribosomal protein L10
MGTEILEKGKAIEFGQMPTRDELLVRLMVNVLRGNLRNLVYALSQIKGQE